MTSSASVCSRIKKPAVLLARDAKQIKKIPMGNTFFIKNLSTVHYHKVIMRVICSQNEIGKNESEWTENKHAFSEEDNFSISVDIPS